MTTPGQPPNRPDPPIEPAAVDPAAETLFAEDLHVDERLITAPVPGLFHPLAIDVPQNGPLRVFEGDEIGTIVQSGEKYPVTSHCTGYLIGTLVLPGERVRIHQPVAWLRSGPLDGPTRPATTAAHTGSARQPR